MMHLQSLAAHVKLLPHFLGSPSHTVPFVLEEGPLKETTYMTLARLFILGLGNSRYLANLSARSFLD